MPGGDDAILKKIGEEATETVLAAKSGDRLHLVRETADLWFHCLIMLARYGLGPRDVLAELQRREGISGLDEKAARKRRCVATRSGSERVRHERVYFLQDRARRNSTKKLFEDERYLAFHDIHPQAAVHFMLIPKVHVATMCDVDMGKAIQRALGKMMAKAGELARQEGATEGFRIIINTGRVAHQEVYHLHMHVIGGPDPLGPMIMRKKAGG